MSLLKFVLFTAAMIAIFSPFSLGQTTYNVTPSSNWCNIINSAQPGSTIVFMSGQYKTTCSITAKGTATSPIVLRSEVEGQAIFNYGGSTSNIFEVHGAFLTISGFSFGPTQSGVDSIRMHQVNDIVIERNTFNQMGGVSIPVNDVGTTIDGLIIRDNRFIDLKTTGIYLGCHSGNCRVRNAIVERNYINGVTSPGTGYGLEVKLNSWATIRDNTVYDTQGPGLMCYGSNQGDLPCIFEGNYVEGSRNEGGIVIGGGPAVIRNNVLVRNALGGISVQDYGGRGLLKNIWIVHNTIADNSDSGINVDWSQANGNLIAYNAFALKTGTPMFKPSSPAGTVIGNVNCNPAISCFVQPTTPPYDFWPVASGPLVNAAGSGSESWRPTDDFMGVMRGSSADAGALERTAAGTGPALGNGASRPPRLSAPQPDITPPTVSVSHSPASNIQTSTSVTITATATDAGGISNIEIFVDGSSKKICNSSPCTHPSTYSSGTHTYYATAKDVANNAGRDPASGTKSFTVTNSPTDCTAPQGFASPCINNVPVLTLGTPTLSGSNVNFNVNVNFPSSPVNAIYATGYYFSASQNQWVQFMMAGTPYPGTDGSTWLMNTASKSLSVPTSAASGGVIYAVVWEYTYVNNNWVPPSCSNAAGCWRLARLNLP